MVTSISEVESKWILVKKKKIKNWKIQVSAAAGNKGNEKLSVKRMVAPFQPVPVQKTAVVKVQAMT